MPAGRWLVLALLLAALVAVPGVPGSVWLGSAPAGAEELIATPAVRIFIPEAERASAILNRADPSPTATLAPGVPTAPSASPTLPPPTPTNPVAPPTASPTPAPGVPAWLNHVNGVRALANLPAVTENAAWSAGGVAHSQYMVKNNFIGHDETVGNAWYSVEGRDAARNGNVAVWSGTSATDINLIDLWVTGPFHMLGIIDPKLQQTGFGSYRESKSGFGTGGTLDVLRGRGTVPSSTQFPVLWPANGKTVTYTRFGGNESPNPLTSCPGYSAPTGMPIYLLYNPGQTMPTVTGSSFQQGGQALEHCRFDSTSYVNSNASEQSLGRSVLSMRRAVVIIPKTPLTPGTTYDVSVTAGGAAVSWNFSVSASAR